MIELESDDGDSITVNGQDITIDNGAWTFTKSIDEWMDLAIEDFEKHKFKKGTGYGTPPGF